MATKSAIVFAGWFPNLERSPFYINDMKKNFKNIDVYFGVNPSNTNYHKTLNLIGYDNVAITSPERVVDSDASAFQSALELLKNSGNQYETIYFIHTKGISYKDDAAWMSSYESYYLGFFRQLAEIEKVLEKNESVGGVSYVGRVEPMNGSGYSTVLDKYFDFGNNAVANIMSLLTFYAIRGKIVNEFIQNAKPEFFTDKLDRYFFETSFPLIVDKMGYERHHLVMW
jgi:predicted subunit of tRNA(5-methylaminomethyl-2-thiouridylate) methyltransferase